MRDPNREEADDIRLRMASVRDDLDGNVQELVGNVHELVDNARKLTDWRYYVKAAPWGAVGAAAAIGYFMVPRRVQIVRPDTDQIAKLAAQHRIVVANAANVGSKGGGAAQAVITMIANAALRAVTAYISQQAGKAMGQQVAETPQHQFNAEVPKP